MQDLHLVGFTTDRRHLIFSARRGAKSGSFLVPVDDELVAAVEDLARDPRRVDDEEAPPVEPPAPRVESKLSVREVQARLRAGDDVAAVAADAEVDVEWVERFSQPVRAEQRQIVERALQLPMERTRTGASGKPLGIAVASAMAERGVPFTDEGFANAWQARLVGSDHWAVEFTYVQRGRSRTATWTYDADAGRVTTSDRSASQLGWVTPPPAPDPPSEKKPGRPARPTPSPAAPAPAPVRESAERPAEPADAPGERSTRGDGRPDSVRSTEQVKRLVELEADERKRLAAEQAAERQRLAEAEAAAAAGARKRTSSSKKAAARKSATPQKPSKQVAGKKTRVKKAATKKTPVNESTVEQAPAKQAGVENTATTGKSDFVPATDDVAPVPTSDEAVDVNEATTDTAGVGEHPTPEIAPEAPADTPPARSVVDAGDDRDDEPIGDDEIGREPTASEDVRDQRDDRDDEEERPAVRITTAPAEPGDTASGPRPVVVRAPSTARFRSGAAVQAGSSEQAPARVNRENGPAAESRPTPGTPAATNGARPRRLRTRQLRAR